MPDVPADTLYNQGLARLHSQDYEASAKKFSELSKQYPYSQWQPKALLMTTFSQYQDGKYDDAIGSAQHYIGLYPSNADTPYVYYLEAMSYYNQIPDVSHDQDRRRKPPPCSRRSSRSSRNPNMPRIRAINCRWRAINSPARKCRLAATT